METGTSRAKLLLIVTVILTLSSCESDIIYSGREEMSSDEWNRNNAALFTAQIDDTLSTASIDLSIRTGTSYPYRNIYLFVTTFAPNGLKAVDTLEYMLTDERGNRLGRGVGDIRELQLNLRKNVFFPIAGAYHFRVEHAMRKETLEGVYDIGLNIKKHPVNKK
jgi:gliding motility-associated lipoprotein GldH